MERVDASERHWGKWYLSQSTPLSLNVYLNWPKNGAPYEIELSSLNSDKKILGWINHLIASGKRDLTLTDIRDFMRACKELQRENLIPKGGRSSGPDEWGY
jgi:hypothetical protein